MKYEDTFEPEDATAKEAANYIKELFARWLSDELESQYGVEASSIARDVANTMDDVELTEWCDRANCWGGPGCKQDSHRFVLQTRKDRFEDDN